MRRQKRRIRLSDILYRTVAMLLVAFMVCMVSGISRYSGQGFFRAVELSWKELADAILGIDYYVPDVEVPIVNCHISTTSYTR